MAEHEKFEVEVLTPEGDVWNGQVEMLATRTGTGSIGIRARHAPLMAMLEPTELRLYSSDNDYEAFAQGEGYLQVKDNYALVLVEDAIRPEDVDEAAVESQLSEARSALERAEDGSAEQDRAKRDITRAEAFLATARGEHPH
jgi:F-type H+-transporting ATPase subunit epsilon